MKTIWWMVLAAIDTRIKYRLQGIDKIFKFIFDLATMDLENMQSFFDSHCIQFLCSDYWFSTFSTSEQTMVLLLLSHMINTNSNVSFIEFDAIKNSRDARKFKEKSFTQIAKLFQQRIRLLVLTESRTEEYHQLVLALDSVNYI